MVTKQTCPKMSGVRNVAEGATSGECGWGVCGWESVVGECAAGECGWVAGECGYGSGWGSGWGSVVGVWLECG